MNGKYFISKLGLALMLCFWCVGVFAKKYTIQDALNARSMDPMEHVCDPEGLLSTEAKGRINQLLVGLEDNLGVKAVVLTLDSIDAVSPVLFAFNLFHNWDFVGKDKDNGILIQLIDSPYLQDIYIEKGTGLVNVLPELVCTRIQDKTMLPLLKQGDRNGALVAGVDSVCQRLYTKWDRPISQQASLAVSGDLWRGLFLLAIPAAFLVLIVWCYRFFRKGAKGDCCPKCHQKYFRFNGTRCLREATDTCEGEAISEWVCANCGYTVEERFAIDKTGTRCAEDSCRCSYIGRTPYDPYYYRDYEIRPDMSADNDQTISYPIGDSWGGGGSGGGGAETDISDYDPAD